jgi:hypothetical protein
MNLHLTFFHAFWFLSNLFVLKLEKAKISQRSRSEKHLPVDMDGTSEQ